MSYRVIMEYGTVYKTDTLQETAELIKELTEAEWRAGEEFEVIVRNDDGEEVLIFSWDQLDNLHAVEENPTPTKKTSHHRGR